MSWQNSLNIMNKGGSYRRIPSVLFLSVVLVPFNGWCESSGAVFVLPTGGLSSGTVFLMFVAVVATMICFFCTRRLKKEITSRKKAEDRLNTMKQELSQSETRYRALFENNPIQTIIVDREGRIVMHNFAGKKPHGALPVIGDIMYRDYAPKHRGDMHGELMHCIQNNEPGEFVELQYNERYLTIYIAPYSEGAIITLMDVTSRKRLADELQQARKMEAIGTLAGGIAHDFNNILSIILGNMELALDDVPTWSPARNHLQAIQTAGLRARDVVRQLLSFSRKRTISRQVMDLGAVIRDSELLLRSSIPAAIDIHIHIAEGLFAVKADFSQIHQVFINLTTNAVQAMEDKSSGTLSIVVENTVLDQPDPDVSETDTPLKYVVLQVSDTGPGVSSDIRKKMFDPYFTTKEVGKGSGMGLSVVHGIVQSHDGVIRVESRPGQGTTVNVFFPATLEHAAVATTVAPPLPGGAERLLLVDDEEAIVEVTTQMMTHLGYRVTGTTSAAQALKMFRSASLDFDLVITDMGMPDMSGESLARELKGIRPEIPVVICTGSPQKLTPEKLKNAGIAACLAKPLERVPVALALRRILDNAVAPES